LALRIKPQDKKTLESAAQREGLSLSSFLLTHALEVARRSNEVDTLTLNREDSLRFAAALENPPSPNAALRKAFRNYQKRQA